MAKTIRNVTSGLFYSPSQADERVLCLQSDWNNEAHTEIYDLTREEQLKRMQLRMTGEKVADKRRGLPTHNPDGHPEKLPPSEIFTPRQRWKWRQDAKSFYKKAVARK